MGGSVLTATLAVKASLPSSELFDAQPPEYRHELLPPDVPVRISIGVGSPLGWERYVGDMGLAEGLRAFGASAPAAVLYERLGRTA